MNQRFSIIIFFAFIGLIFINTHCLANENTGRTTQIIVNEFSQVHGEQVLLGQIARIDAIPFIREVLENISLGRSPKPGKIKTFPGNRIAARIRSGQDLPGALEVIAPDKVYVKQAHQEVSEQTIRSKVEQWLDDYFTDKEYKIKSLRIQSTDLYPAGMLELTPSVPLKLDGKGNLNFPISVLVDNQKVDTLRVRGKVAVYEMVLCAADNLEKGRAVGTVDVVSLKKDVFSLHESVIKDIGEIEECRLKIDVKKGSPIKGSWLAPLPLIRKGEVVSLVARANALKIVTSGIAAEDGFKGRPVKVENLTSGKLVRGIAKTASTVEVVY